MTTHEGINEVGVVGSGIMGSGLVEVIAGAGYSVIARSRAQATADQLLHGLEKSLEKKVAKGRMSTDDRDGLLGRVKTATELDALSGCDLVIESIVEDLPTKQALFATLADITGEHALLATNTSTLPVIELAMRTTRPERVCGIHFFNPAPAMALVEVVRALTTSDATVDDAKAFARSCGKSPVEVKDRAGFIVNALLFPYCNNAVRMLDAGIAARDDIDTAMKGGAGLPMGPLELLDLVGLDTSLSILEALHAEFADPNYAPAPLLRRMVTAQRLGRKTGAGFYDYTK